MKKCKKLRFSKNQKKMLWLQKWNKTYLAVLLGYETIIWHHRSQNLGFCYVLMPAHCGNTHRKYTVTKKFLVSFNGQKERLKCKFWGLGYYCTCKLSFHPNSTQDLSLNFLVDLRKYSTSVRKWYFSSLLKTCILQL